MTDFKIDSNDHMDRLLYVVRNVASFRSLEAVLAEEPNPAYWIYVLNNFYDLALLEWCKLFGSYGEPTHWTSLVPKSDHDSFRKDLWNQLGITEPDWRVYWEHVTDYRNHRLAHHQRNTKITNYPALENILKSAFYYHSWLLRGLEDMGIIEEPNSLSDYYASYLRQAVMFSKRAYEETKNIREAVS